MHNYSVSYNDSKGKVNVNFTLGHALKAQRERGIVLLFL